MNPATHPFNRKDQGIHHRVLVRLLGTEAPTTFPCSLSTADIPSPSLSHSQNPLTTMVQLIKNKLMSLKQTHHLYSGLSLSFCRAGNQDPKWGRDTSRVIQKVGGKNRVPTQVSSIPGPDCLSGTPSPPFTWKKTQTHRTDESERGVLHHRGLCPSQQHTPRAFTQGFTYAETPIFSNRGEGNQGRLPGGDDVIIGSGREDLSSEEGLLKTCVQHK
jgi:hypothetical protein